MATKKQSTTNGVVYDKVCKDYGVYVQGRYVGSRARRLEADELYNHESTKQARFEGFINGYKAAMAGTDVAEALHILEAA